MARSGGKGFRPGTEQTHRTPAAVVGVGVGPASLASLERLFAHMPPDLDAAHLVAVRQEEGLTVDMVVEAVKRSSPLPVTVAPDGEALKAGRVYVNGPQFLLTVKGERALSHPMDQPQAADAVVDTLLLSLGEAYDEHMVAVVLQGLGSDGTAGVASTKGRGGLAIAERVDGDEPIGSATPVGIADLLLPPEAIAAQIAAYVRNLVLTREAGGLDGLEQQAAAHMADIAAILRQVTGNDFHGYKQNTFLRRVARRMQVIGLAEVDLYVDRLRDDPEEARRLFQDLLIGVTHFFRDPQEFDLLEREAIPAMFAGKGPIDKVRVWVVGCATGEEAYSLAMLLREHALRFELPPQIQIFATDLDARALAVARAARYPDTIERHVSPERLARWFVKEGETYRVAKDLREMCVFSPQNVLRDAPFSRVDLLSCRNLLIYLDPGLQLRVIPIFHFALNPGGFLFLGNAENVTRHSKLFAPLDRGNRIYRRLETVDRGLPEFPLTPAIPGAAGAAAVAGARRRSSAVTLGQRAEAVAEKYAPAYAVVDAQGDVLHFSGRTGRYLQPLAGAASLNLLNLVHRELRLDLRGALQRAVAQGLRTETPAAVVQIDGRASAVKLIVEPVAGEEPLALVVVFLDAGAADGGHLPADTDIDDQVQRLEGELSVVKDQLQASIEALERTNEELKSSNEEYQSINEELQSANEELETSKEELQSVNEELRTVNYELASQATQLGESNSDLKNLLESTQIATIFLDNDLRVRNFTPAAVEVFHLMETDAGRPIGHIAPRVAYPDLQTDVRRVIRTLAPLEREVAGEGERRFMVRILPYRSVDNFIAGAVVTFTDLTERARAEVILRDSEQRLRLALDAAAIGAFVWHVDTNRTELDPRLLSLLGQDADASRTRQGGLEDLLHPDDRSAYAAAVAAALDPGGDREVREDVRVAPAGGEDRWLTINGRVIFEGEPPRPRRLIGAAIDITSRKHREADLVFLAEVAEVLAGLNSAEDIMEAVAAKVGAHLGLTGCKFLKVDDGDDAMVVDYGWAVDGLAALSGEVRLSSYFPEAFRREARAGATIAIADVACDVRAREKPWTALGVQALVAAPYHHEGRWAALLLVCDRQPRVWSTAETQLIGELSGRIFPRLERIPVDQALRQSEERLKLLLAELQHRVRNTLAVVRSIARRTAVSADSVEDYAAHLDGRINAFARTQAAVTRDPDSGVGLDMIIGEELLAYATREGAQATVKGPDVRFAPKPAETMALAIHELATNSIKYGALATETETGTVAITWSVEGRDGGRWLSFEWRETAGSISGGRPSRRGFGTELLERTLAYELGATTTLDFQPGSFVCRIGFDLTGKAVAEPSPPHG